MNIQVTLMTTALVAKVNEMYFMKTHFYIVDQWKNLYSRENHKMYMICKFILVVE